MLQNNKYLCIWAVYDRNLAMLEEKNVYYDVFLAMKCNY
jgi:hypothetical protein